MTQMNVNFQTADTVPDVRVYYDTVSRNGTSSLSDYQYLRYIYVYCIVTAIVMALPFP
jgi:hypothetical protein